MIINNKNIITTTDLFNYVAILSSLKRSEAAVVLLAGCTSLGYFIIIIIIVIRQHARSQTSDY
jgi:hypothetical protein